LPPAQLTPPALRVSPAHRRPPYPKPAHHHQQAEAARPMQAAPHRYPPLR
jgi:hypothetical protein